MTPVHIEMLISQIMFWGIFIFSLCIWYEFYRATDKGKLRSLIMELFLTKAWVYGFAGAYYLIWDLGYFQNSSALWVRIICNVPMVFVMWRLYRFIKWGK